MSVLFGSNVVTSFVALAWLSLKKKNEWVLKIEHVGYFNFYKNIIIIYIIHVTVNVMFVEVD